jgi:nucleoid DNA-binding protein
MIKDKISSQEIIDLVSSKASVSKRAAEEFLKVMIASIEEALMAGEVVKIKNFGTFKLQWNEPRKSVNVHTGEDIIIPGYSKVTFVPDVVLKNVVNEPFAHLEPVVLDGDDEDSDEIAVDEVTLDPLRVLNEQAADIKGLLADIQALSPKKKQMVVEEVLPTEEVKSERIEIQDYDLTALDDIEVKKGETAVNDDKSELKKVEEVIIPEAILDLKPEVAPEIETKIKYTTAAVESETDISSYDIPKYEDDILTTEPVVSEEYVSNPFLDNHKFLKKKKRWLVPAGLLALLVVLFGLYFLVPPVTSLVDSSLTSLKNATADAKQNFSMTEMFNTVSKWAEPKKATSEIVVVPKTKQVVDSIGDSIAKPNLGSAAVKPLVKSIDKPIPVKKSVDSLQLMLDGPRVYKKFIGSERITSGSRLTLMSKKYYKKSDFWVYIYEANKANIPNPDHIAAGTLIQIPRLDPRLIDVSNPKCMKKALELHDLYVKKRQQD